MITFLDEEEEASSDSSSVKKSSVTSPKVDLKKKKKSDIVTPIKKGILKETTTPASTYIKPFITSTTDITFDPANPPEYNDDNLYYYFGFSDKEEKNTLHNFSANRIQFLYPVPDELPNKAALRAHFYKETILSKSLPYIKNSMHNYISWRAYTVLLKGSTEIFGSRQALYDHAIMAKEVIEWLSATDNTGSSPNKRVYGMTRDIQRMGIFINNHPIRVPDFPCPKQGTIKGYAKKKLEDVADSLFTATVSTYSSPKPTSPATTKTKIIDEEDDDDNDDFVDNDDEDEIDYPSSSKKSSSSSSPTTIKKRTNQFVEAFQDPLKSFIYDNYSTYVALNGKISSKNLEKLVDGNSISAKMRKQIDDYLNQIKTNSAASKSRHNTNLAPMRSIVLVILRVYKLLDKKREHIRKVLTQKRHIKWFESFFGTTDTKKSVAVNMDYATIALEYSRIQRQKDKYIEDFYRIHQVEPPKRKYSSHTGTKKLINNPTLDVADEDLAESDNNSDADYEDDVEM